MTTTIFIGFLSFPQANAAISPGLSFNDTNNEVTPFVGMSFWTVGLWRILIAALLKGEFAVFLFGFWNKMIGIYAASSIAPVMQFFDGRMCQFPENSVNASVVIYGVPVFQFSSPQPAARERLCFNSFKEIFRNE